MGYESLQFRGLEEVIAAFDNRDAEAWSVWHRKQFLFKGIGSDELEATLKMIGKNATGATYTLKVYEEPTIREAKNIKSTTPDDGSFNFKLLTPEEEAAKKQFYVSGAGQNNVLEQIMQRLDKIEQQRTIVDEPEEKTLGSVITDVLSDPAKTMQWINIFKTVWNNQQGSNPGFAMQQLPAVIGNTNPQTDIEVMTDEKLAQCEIALDTLGRNDPKIVEHLNKLATISEKNPGQFKLLLSMLEAM